MSDETPPIAPEGFVTREVEVRLTVDLSLHPEVIDRVDDEWRASLYDLHGETEIIQHLLYNLLQGRRIDQLDGWADLPPSAAYVNEIVELRVEEVGDGRPLPDYEVRGLRYALDAWQEAQHPPPATPDPAP